MKYRVEIHKYDMLIAQSSNLIQDAKTKRRFRLQVLNFFHYIHHDTSDLYDNKWMRFFYKLAALES
jgi:hypothetical protein